MGKLLFLMSHVTIHVKQISLKLLNPFSLLGS